MFTVNSLLKVLFIAIGFILTIIFIIGYSNTDEKIRNLFKILKKLNKGE